MTEETPIFNVRETAIFKRDETPTFKVPQPEETPIFKRDTSMMAWNAAMVEGEILFPALIATHIYKGEVVETLIYKPAQSEETPTFKARHPKRLSSSSSLSTFHFILAFEPTEA